MNAVKITYFLAPGTVDDVLWPMVRTKMKVLGEVVEGNGDMDMTLQPDEPVRTKKYFIYLLLTLVFCQRETRNTAMCPTDNYYLHIN